MFIQENIEKISFPLENLHPSQLNHFLNKINYNYLMEVLLPEYLLLVVIKVLGVDLQAADEMFNPKI